MAIACVGDVHRSWAELERVVSKLPREVQTVIQVGDLGLHADDLPPHRAHALPQLDRRVLFIDGNWDHYPLGYLAMTEPTEVAPNLIYVPRGTVLELEGRRVGLLGGGDSLPGGRREGVDWWPEERVTNEDVARLVRVAGGRPLDLLVTHVPPAFVVLHTFRLGAHPSTYLVERAWRTLGEPPLICGHMHKSRRVGQVTVLDELEVALL